ncbi:hypothetical protein RSOL_056660, partial [Rhizoctonia solani AG-3 Rhs1AP]
MRSGIYDDSKPAIAIFRLHAPAYLAEQPSEVFQHAPDDIYIAGNSSVVTPSAPVPSVSSGPQPAPPPFAHLEPIAIPRPEASASGESKTTAEPCPNPVVMIRAEFELHSESQNQPTVIDSIELPSNMPPLDLRRAILDAMGLDAETARLTYSITGQVGKATTYSFNTLSQVEDAKQNVLGAISRARSKKKGLLIKNAVRIFLMHI